MFRKILWQCSMVKVKEEVEAMDPKASKCLSTNLRKMITPYMDIHKYSEAKQNKSQHHLSLVCSMARTRGSS